MDILKIIEIIRNTKDIKNKDDIYNEIILIHKINDLTNDNFNILYNIILQDPSLSNQDILNLYNNFFIFVNKDIIINTINIEFQNFNYEIQLLKLLNILYIFYVKPTKIILLWNNAETYNFENLKNLDILYQSLENKTTPSLNLINQNVEIIKIPFNNLKYYISKNYDLIFNNNLYRIFNNLRRIVGINSNGKYLLNYSININKELYYNFYDTLHVKHVYINEKRYLLSNVYKIFLDNNEEIINKIDLKPFIKCFLNFNLSSLIPLIYNYKETVLKDDDNNKKYKIPKLIDIKFKLQSYCEHEDELKKLKKITPDYNTRMNEFVYKYIIYNNKIPICNLCGFYIPLFNIQEGDYLKNKGEMVITLVKTNIFSTYPYNQFTNASITFNYIIHLYDMIFKSYNIDNINNIAKLTIDYFIQLNNKRLEYEKKYQSIINTTNLFFIRTNSNLFNINFNIKEKFIEKKILNLYIIITIITFITSSFNDILDTFKIKNIYNDNIEIIITNVLSLFLKRVLNVKEKNIEIIFKTYIETFHDELKNLYNVFIKNWKEINKIYKLDLFYIEYSQTSFQNPIPPKIKLDLFYDQLSKIEMIQLDEIKSDKIVDKNKITYLHLCDFIKNDDEFNLNNLNKYLEYDFYLKDDLIKKNSFKIIENLVISKNTIYYLDDFKLKGNNIILFLLGNYDYFFNINSFCYNENELIILLLNLNSFIYLYYPNYKLNINNIQYPLLIYEVFLSELNILAYLFKTKTLKETINQLNNKLNEFIFL